MPCNIKAKRERDAQSDENNKETEDNLPESDTDVIEGIHIWDYFKEDEILGYESMNVLSAVEDMIIGAGGPIELDDSEVKEILSIDEIERHAYELWTWSKPPALSEVYIAKILGPSKFRFERKWLTDEAVKIVAAQNFDVGDTIEVAWTYSGIAEGVSDEGCRRYYVVLDLISGSRVFYQYAERNVRLRKWWKKK